MSFIAKHYINKLMQLGYREDYIDSAFQLLIDNKIKAYHLEEILSAVNYELPKEFFELNKTEQKKYRQYLITTYEYVNGEFVEDSYTIFNRPFFDDLVNSAKESKDKDFTLNVIDYLTSLEDLNYFFFGSEFIDVRKTALTKIPGMGSYLKEHKEIKTLYDLLLKFIPFRKDKNERFNELRNSLINELRRKELFNIQFLDDFIFFMVVMERLLSNLPKKERNTLKLKCLILNKKDLKEDEYYLESNKSKRIYIKDYLKKADIELLNKYSDLFDAKFLGKSDSYLSKEDINKLPPNGYSVLYQILRSELDG